MMAGSVGSKGSESRSSYSSEVNRGFLAVVLALTICSPGFLESTLARNWLMALASLAIFIGVFFVIRFFMPPMYPRGSSKSMGPIREWIELHSGAIVVVVCFLPTVAMWSVKYHNQWILIGGTVGIVALAAIAETAQRTTRHRIEKLWGIGEKDISREASDAAAADAPSSPPSPEK
jgi:ABC-type transport system involved in multi-copper enzyme maturation permease subunit